MKKESGITLIALVITIIVLLILAQITINLTIGEKGILKRAEDAGKNYTNAADYEREQLAEFTNTIDNMINGLGKSDNENTQGDNKEEESPVILPFGTITRTENNIKYTSDGVGNTIPVPVGFSPITTQDQGVKETGFVIKNDDDYNEFVWVPVEGMTYSYNRYAFLSDQPEEGTDETTNSIKIKYGSNSFYFIEAMPNIEENRTELQSVTEYGGYYIGRYEAGVASTEARTSSSGTTDEILVQEGKQVYNYIKNTDAKIKAESLYTKTNDNIISRLCSGYAWDTALKFIKTQNNTYPTISIGGYYGKSEPTTTGYDTVHPCNIYDMGGNVYEWTTETCNGLYTKRGGAYFNWSASSASAAYRSTDYAGEMAYDGFRVALFL